MIIDVFRDFFLSTGLFNLDLKSFAMIIVALIFIYLAIKKGFEPLLLVPIGFGMLLSNIPLTGSLTLLQEKPQEVCFITFTNWTRSEFCRLLCLWESER